LLGPNAYLLPFDFCISTKATRVPDSPDWLHEVMYDGGPCGHKLKLMNPDSPAM